jgi:hypothetical protein
MLVVLVEEMMVTFHSTPLLYRWDGIVLQIFPPTSTLVVEVVEVPTIMVYNPLEETPESL